MKYAFIPLAFALLGAVSGSGSAAAAPQGNSLTLTGSRCILALSADNGSILALRQRGKLESLLHSGEQGLWQARFQDGKEINAAQFSAKSSERSFRAESVPGQNALRLHYLAPELAVTVTVAANATGLDFTAALAPKTGTLLDFALPGRLRFDPASVQRFVCPINGNFGVGAAFNSNFFRLQPQDNPSGWQPRNYGTRAAESLFGGPLDQRADNDPPTALRLGANGSAWLSGDIVARVSRAKACVNRPFTRKQADLVVVDSDNGPYFAANRLGGNGALWRLGGRVGADETTIAADLVLAVVNKLATQAPAGRRKLGLISLIQGPDRGGWAAVPVADWENRFLHSSALAGGKCQMAKLTTPEAVLKALQSDEYLAILNPYGEQTPVTQEGGMAGTLTALRRYVRAGGNWFEVGGYSFYYEMLPIRYLNYNLSYPPAFADFFHLDATGGSASLYRVQPQTSAPWEGARNKEAIFVPGRLACGGDERGGYCDRAFGVFVTAGQQWSTPTVRLATGSTAPESVRAYCAANNFTRGLPDKMKPETLAKFKQSVLVFYGGTAREKLAYLDRLPAPSLIHFSDYLKGGFDKQYPDHLPPRPEFGTPAEFSEFFTRSHQLGHLIMPYTNPTWWCEGPKGPTFEREGEAPLLKNLNGKVNHEQYAANGGYTITMWHPAVQAANRLTRKQFTEEYPVDVLFQDQCGARGWHYDTNPASPTPYAYSDGMISMVAEDSRIVPLSTEAGWDRVVNYESQLCGLSFQLVPTEGGPAWRQLMKYSYPPRTWDVFPLAQYIAHDKTAMLYHDLGQFVTNRQVLSWTLGLGFNMSYRLSANALANDAPREWLYWLDRLQKSVCARSMGTPVLAFKHDRGPNPTLDDDGVMRATYGPVQVVANLNNKEYAADGRVLPPYGFYAAAPGMIAANLKQLGGQTYDDNGISFVSEGTANKADIWVYAPQGTDAAVQLPAAIAGAATVTFDGQPAAPATIDGGILRVRLPRRDAQLRIAAPAALAGKAPRDWPGARPAIGILDFGAGISLSWTDITPAQWVDAFQQSRLAREWQAPVRRITTVAQLTEALQAGPTAWLAIINPYGEKFPCAAGQPKEMLAKIRAYVNNGGSWWETGGYSFYVGFTPDNPSAPAAGIGGAGMASFGLPTGGGAVEQLAEPLKVPAEGRAWLGEALSKQVENCISSVNRGLARGAEDPGHVTLVAGKDQDFIGGYRLEGWGWLWRIGGMNPNPAVALPVAVGAMEYLYTHPAPPAKAGGISYLWHAVVQGK